MLGSAVQIGGLVGQSLLGTITNSYAKTGILTATGGAGGASALGGAGGASSGTALYGLGGVGGAGGAGGGMYVGGLVGYATGVVTTSYSQTTLNVTGGAGNNGSDGQSSLSGSGTAGSNGGAGGASGILYVGGLI